MNTEKEIIPSGTENKKIKMLHAAKWYNPVVGGIETVAEAITGAVHGTFDMSILVCSEHKDRELGLTLDGTEIYRAKTPGKLFSMPLSYDYIKAFKRMGKDADIIQLHAPFPLSDFALFLSRGCKKAKKAVWWHSDVVKQKKLMFFYKPLMKWMLRKTDKIFVASESIIAQSKYIGKFRDKIEVIPFGISIENYERGEKTPILTEKLNDKNNLKLLFVGRLVSYKGVEVLLDAMAKTSGVELFIIGSGDLDEALAEQTERLQIKDKIHFLGTVETDDLKSAFNDCDMFVLPSVTRAECFGLVQLEAMVYGKPVINTSLPTAVPEVSLDKISGLTVTPGSATELAEAINKLATDKDLRKQYGNAARKRCQEQYNLDVMQKTILCSYKNMLGID